MIRAAGEETIEVQSEDNSCWVKQPEFRQFLDEWTGQRNNKILVENGIRRAKEDFVFSGYFSGECLSLERVLFSNSRNKTLVGHLYPSHSTSIIIMAHGFTSDKFSKGRFDAYIFLIWYVSLVFMLPILKILSQNETKNQIGLGD